MKRVLYIILIVLMVSLIGISFGENKEMSEVNNELMPLIGSDETDEVVVGIYENLPLVGIDENNEPTGLFVDIMDYIAEKERFRVRYELNTLSDSLIKLENGELDIVLGIAYTDERDEKFDYNNETIYTNWGQVYAKESLNIESFLDLEGVVIGVETSDVHYDSVGGIKSILEAFNVHVEYKEYPSRSEMFVDLESGLLDVGIVSRLYAEYNNSSNHLDLTPIQFNPIKIKTIISDSSNGYLLKLVDSNLVELKNDKTSIYHQNLDNMLQLNEKFQIPHTVIAAIVLLIMMLLTSVVTLVMSRKLIRKQDKSIIDQNYHLKQLLSCISSLSNIHEMDELFAKFVSHIRGILGDDSIEVVSIIKYDDGYHLDTFEYVTGKYVDQANLLIDQSRVNQELISNLDKMNHSGDHIMFAEDMIICKYESSHDCDGYIYIESSREMKEKDFLSIYMINLLSSLRSIIINNARIEEKTKLLVSLGELIEKRDQFVANHVKRVSDASTTLAKLSGYREDRINHITISSSIHDIGKIFVPDHILNKQGRLSVEEFEVIKTHATDKFEFIENVEDSLSRTVHNVVRYHHENWDGSGYPEGLKGSEIPLEARIVSIIDVFEALTHKRSYKDAWSYEKAVSFITDNVGTKFDPELVDVFKIHSRELFDVFLLSPDEEDTTSIV